MRRDPFPEKYHRTRLFSKLRRVCWISALCSLLLATSALADGVTIITHGWNPNLAGTPAWLGQMRSAIASERLGGDENFGTITVSGSPLTAVCSPWDVGLSGSSTGEIIVILDWSSVADHLLSGVATQDVVDVVLDKILEGQNGERPLAELPLHLIGHSRGGSLVCELARRLGEQGVMVDHLTLLDPHPLTMSDPQPIPPVIDAEAKVYENVLFADSYYQLISYPQGQYITGAYNRQWTSIPGGYHDNPIDNVYPDHRNIHLAYHGTIDLNTPTSNGEAELGSSERAAWFNDYETDGGVRGAHAGFYYSRIDGHGDRMSTDQPVAGGDRIIDGYHNDPLLGGAGTRESLTWTSAVWPSVATLEILRDGSPLGPGAHTVIVGESLELRYVWRDADSASDVTLRVDMDRNPYNSNDVATITTQNHAASGSALLQSTASWDTSGLPVGQTLYVYAEITDGTHTRYLYAAPSITTSSTTDVSNWTDYD